MHSLSMYDFIPTKTESVLKTNYRTTNISYIKWLISLICTKQVVYLSNVYIYQMLILSIFSI